MKKRKKTLNKKDRYILLFGILLLISLIVTFIFFNSEINKSRKQNDLIENEVKENKKKTSENTKEIVKISQDFESLEVYTETLVLSLLDSLDAMKREIAVLKNTISQQHEKQKSINEYWASKTLSLLNWKLDIEEKNKGKDSVPAPVVVKKSEEKKEEVKEKEKEGINPVTLLNPHLKSITPRVKDGRETP